MSHKSPVTPADSQPRSIVEAYHRAWTSGDVEAAMAFVADDVACRAPGVDLHGKSEYEQFIGGFAPRLTGLIDIASFADGNRVALFYCPQTAVADAAPVAECFTVEGGKIVDSVLIFDRLSFAPPQTKRTTVRSGGSKDGMRASGDSKDGRFESGDSKNGMPASDDSKDGRFESPASKDAGQRDLLVARLRGLLADETAVREVSMFGGRAFMVNEKMAVHASKNGDLLVRVDVADDAKFSEVPGASPAEISPGRAMGAGWIRASAASVADDEQLRFWLDAALAYNRALTGKRR